MEQRDTYTSVAGESRGTYREKASRFIGLALPVESEEEARLKLETVRKEYYDANHHCFAYRLGPSGETYRISDDGEPSGSAGRPIHGQLLSANLSDILIVVVRYFGGTKLGVPGLINAYRTAAKEAIAHAVLREKVLTDRFTVTFEYAHMNDIMKILKESGVSIHKQESGNACSILFSIRRSKSETIRRKFESLKNIYTSFNVS